MDDVVSNIDALVSDEPTIMSYPYGIDSPLRSGTPSFPPGFGHMQPMQHPTPPPPPGFSRPMTPATSMTPSNLSQQAFPKPPIPVVPIVDRTPTPAKERPETPEPQEEDKQQPVQPPTGKRTTRVVSLASNASATTALVESAKAAKAPEPAHAPVAVHVPVPVAQEAPAPPTPPPATPLKLTKKNSVLQDEDFPALDAASMSATKPAASTQARASKPSTPVGKKTAEKRPVPAVLNLAATSKPAVVKAAEASPALSDKHTTADMSSAFPSLPTPAAPWSPAVRAAPPKTLRVVQTPKTESGPAPVLSLAAITAAENAKLTTASTSSTPTLTSAVLANRQASLSNRPSTPASEIVSLSDNASVVSTSISASRPGSPPPQPTRIGSAAVRNTTKSQQRKQRKQASKMDAAAVVEAATSTSTSFSGQAVNEQDEEPVEIAPIMGRKKKQKKEKPAPAPAAAVTTPVETPATEPATAAAAAKAPKEEKEAKEKEKAAKEKEAKETKERAKQSSAAKKREDAKEKAAAAAAAEAAAKAAAAEKAKSSSKAATTATPAAATTGVTVESSAAAASAAANATVLAPLEQVQKMFEKEQEALRKVLREAADVAGSTTLSVVQDEVVPVKSDTARPGGSIRSVALDLAARGMIDNRLENISFLQPFVTLAQSRNVARNTVIKGDALLPPDVLFSKDDLNDIVAGKAVRKYVDDVRLLATPNGDCLRNLTEAEENRFMTLQMRLGNSLASPLSYTHPRYEETGGFNLIAKRAVPCGPPSYYPVKALAPAGIAGQMIFDPMSKIQREEAVYWINQYVLPRLNLLPQSEAASWQSMLVDTGVPQAIGTTTLAPWIYHTPEMRYGMPVSGFSSSSISTSSIATNGNGTAHGSANPNHADDRRQSTSSNNTDAGPTLGNHSTTNNHDSALTYTNGGQSSGSSAHSSRNGGPSGLIVDRDSVDLKNDLESSVHAMSVEDAERSLIEARREAKIYERALIQLIKMNGRLLLMTDESFAKIAGGSSSSTGGPGSDAGSFDRPSPPPVVTTAY
ncbi:transcriptional repressor general negative regulator of transcription subunit 4 [Sporothrix stenoceras]|uniref:Transcriptional repressor general negative regulator of transcription subunit 4 n=1 Tax=Sporothrix stenoceras TaxID=5173 RepID=A0ABR3ZF77_9PEZI